MQRSGASVSRADRKIGSLALSGQSTGTFSDSASVWTGEGVSLSLRPEGAGGWVTTETISNPPPRPSLEAARRRESVRAATSGVPRNTTRLVPADLEEAVQEEIRDVA